MGEAAQRPSSFTGFCLPARSHHSEGGSLGVAGLNDPCAAGDFNEAVQNCGAKGSGAIGRADGHGTTTGSPFDLARMKAPCSTAWV